MRGNALRQTWLQRFSTAILVAGCCVPGLAAQQVRVRSTTTARYIQLRPLALDSAGAWTAGAVTEAVPLAEDVELSAWGFGVQGLRAYGLLRLRADVGSELVWPRYGDHFDALAAYLELERTRWRLRLGRQQHASGLGLYGFDGGAVTWRPVPNVRLEGYGGRGLARGYNDPVNSSAILTQDPLIPDRGTLLVGFSAWAAPGAQSFASATYQREILNDLSGLVSERVALDAQTTVGRRLTLAGSSDFDLGTGAVGKARLGATTWLPHSASLGLALFRYRPTFDLTTIWGVFAPQAHRGTSVSATLPPLGAVTLNAGWTLRVYEDITETTPFLRDVGTTTHDFSVGGAWSHQAVSVRGSYTFITGYGGQESAGDVRVALDGADDRWLVGLNLAAFQNNEYFRVARGTVLGFGADGRYDVTDRLTVGARLMQYIHTGTTGMDAPDWSQTRALLQVDWIMGANPDRVAGYR